MKVEEKDFELEENTQAQIEERHIDADLNLHEFIDIIRDTNDEVLQVEELRLHTENLKRDLVNYFTGIMKKYKLELKVPSESLPLKDDGSNLQAIFFNSSGIISYHFNDGSVKSYRLNDYHPSELMKLLSVIMPHLKEALEIKRREYEKISNALSKIKKYLVLLTEKFKDMQKEENLH